MRFYLFFSVLLFPWISAHASCGSESCPVDTKSLHDEMSPGDIRIDYSLEYIDQDQPRISRRSAPPGEIIGHHDEIYTLNQIQRIGLDMGITRRWSIQTILPFIHREHQHIHNHNTGPERESWNFDGMGDLTVLNRFAINPGPDRTVYSLMAGGVAPTGRTEILNAEGEEAEAGILPGQEAWSLILGGSVRKGPAFFSSTYQWNSKGEDDYKIGNIWLANAGIALQLFPKMSLLGQVNLRVNRRDDKGNTGEEVQKTGGEFVYVSPGLQFDISNQLSASFIVQIPVYQRVNVIQLTSDYNLLTSFSYRFSVL